MRISEEADTLVIGAGALLAAGGTFLFVASRRRSENSANRAA